MDSVKLWTPQGSTYVGGNTAGYNEETGVSIVVHTFQFNDPETGRGQIVKIPADPSISKAHIEDMAAQSFENWLLEIKVKGKVRKPTTEQRKEVGKAIREFREYASKRRESTNNKIYYGGTKV